MRQVGNARVTNLFNRLHTSMQGTSVWQWITTRISKQGWVALVISVLLHSLLFSQWHWSLWSDHIPERTTIEARLVLKQALPMSAPRLKPTLKSKALAPNNSPSPAPPPSTNPVPVAQLPEVAPQAMPAVNDVDAIAITGDAPFATDPDTVVVTDDEAAGLMPPYSRADTEFAIFVNGDKRPSGTAHIGYVGQDGQYALRWQIEGSGLLKLLYPSLVQESRGEILPHGLRPQFYRYAFGQRASKTYEAKFNWSERVLTLVSSKGEVVNDLPLNTQDMLSFMYQFMFVPPLQMMQVAITNGKRIGEYEYAFEGEESLQIGSQTVQTMHIAHHRGETDEKVELWLATDYRYLPVKIRKIDKHGMVIEQIATQLNVQ